MGPQAVPVAADARISAEADVVVVADLATGAKPIVDFRTFRLSRFHDNTRPQPLAGV